MPGTRRHPLREVFKAVDDHFESSNLPSEAVGQGLVDGEVHNQIVVPENQKYWTKVALDRMLSIR